MPHTYVTLILVSDKPSIKLAVAKLITLHVSLYDSIQPSTYLTTYTPPPPYPIQPFFQLCTTFHLNYSRLFCDVINSFLGVYCTVNKEHPVWSARLSVQLWQSISGHRFSGFHKVPHRSPIGCPNKTARFKVRAIVVLLGWRHWKFDICHFDLVPHCRLLTKVANSGVDSRLGYG